MFKMRLIVALIFMATHTTSFAAVSAKSSPPIVYTGMTTFPQTDGTPIYLITRLHLIKTGVNPAGGDNYRAIVIHHLSDDGSNEYTTFNYAFTTINPKTRRLVLSPSVNTEASPKLPEWDLTFDESFEVATGSMTNHFIAERSGTVSLRQGWDYDKSLPVETRYGGMYDISCPEAPHAVMAQAKRVLISPHRAPSFVSEISGSLDSDMTYVGGVVTGYLALAPNATVGAVFHTGRVKFIQRKLVLMESRNEWTCDRLDQQKMLCRSTYHGACELRKIDDNHESLQTRAPVVTKKIEIPTQSTRTDTEPPECQEWDRTFYGFLRHRVGARLQAMKIDMRTLSRLDESGKTVCDLQVNGRLSFGSNGKLSLRSTEMDNGTIIYKFPVKTIDPGARMIQINSTRPAEIILTIRRFGDDQFSFDWISDIFGFIGDVVVSENPDDSDLPTVADRESFQGLTDYFQSERFGDQFLFMSMKTTPRITTSWGHEENPFAAVEVNGWILQRHDRIAVEDSPRFAIRPDIYFDFYTNYFTLMDGNIISGQLTPTGLVTRSIRTGLYAVFQMDFMRHTWTRVPFDSTLPQSIKASLQPLSSGAPSGSSGQRSKKFNMVFATQLPDVKRITFLQSDIFYSTTDWGSMGTWKKVVSREVMSDWENRKSVTVFVRYVDDRLVMVEFLGLETY